MKEPKGMHTKSLSSSLPFQQDGASAMVPAGEMNPQPALTSVGQAQYDCVHYSTCLGIAADQGWAGLSCEACTAYRAIPGEAIPDDACAQLLGAVLRTAQHDLQQNLDDNFWEAAAFVFHQQDFAILCGLLDIDVEAARQAHWVRLTSVQKRAIAERWPQHAQTLDEEVV
jgi:hypothetical protein